jgi:DNA polymerase-1
MSIKNCFVSRYADGYIVEADWKQLEIAALAILSGDKNLILDLQSGKDLHRRNAAQLYLKPENRVSGHERRVAKQLSFQLQYGASAPSMAKNLGIQKQICQRFIDQYYERYPKVKEWQDANIVHVQAARRPTPIGMAYADLPSPTGRFYRFHEEESPYHPHPTFRPTVIKNYPVQGFATGDIIPLMIGILFRELKERYPSILLINTIHDSVLLDVPGELLQACFDLLHEVLDQTSKQVYNVFKIEVPLPLTVDVKYGKTWGDMRDEHD